MDLPRRIEGDTTVRFVDHLPAPFVPSYLELDQRIGWSPTGKIELSLIGRNLLDRQHPEFGAPSPAREEVRRNIYGRIVLRF